MAGPAAGADQACQAFRGMLGAKVLICKPADPEAKGMVERLHDYLETLVPARPRLRRPGRLQHSACRSGWTGRTVAGNRALGCAPADRIDADRAAMLALPPVPPVTGWQSSIRLPRDHYVRLDSNDYSVHPSVIGRRIEVRADLDRVQVWCDGAPGRRPCAGVGQTPDHLRPGASCRRQALRRGRIDRASAHPARPRSRQRR